MALPNVMAADVPEGASEDDNVEVKTHGTPPDMPWAREHFDIPSVAPHLDFETAAKLSGSRFALLSGPVARLHRALAQFMLDTHIDQNGLTEMNPPVLVRDEAMQGTGQLPKFGEDSYQTTNGWWLIPTAEVPLTNTVAGQTLDAATLPRRMVAHTLCFRSEAGSAGKDTAGMLRQHQFEKVEMVSVTHPDHSDDEQLRMLACAEGILEALKLPYRTVKLCDGDTGFGARRTFDIEVWLPGQNRYREISSVSNCWDFQARRMNARFKPEDGGKPQFLHTLNGSGLAIGRALIAVLENYQQKDGTVEVPEVLRGMSNSFDDEATGMLTTPTGNILELHAKVYTPRQTRQTSQSSQTAEFQNSISTRFGQVPVREHVSLLRRGKWPDSQNLLASSKQLLHRQQEC